MRSMFNALIHTSEFSDNLILSKASRVVVVIRTKYYR